MPANHKIRKQITKFDFQNERTGQATTVVVEYIPAHKEVPNFSKLLKDLDTSKMLCKELYGKLKRELQTPDLKVQTKTQVDDSTFQTIVHECKTNRRAKKDPEAPTKKRKAAAVEEEEEDDEEEEDEEGDDEDEPTESAPASSIVAAE
jgi:hypothetical protein